MIKITYYGHNCFLFENDIKLLSDPFIQGNPLAQDVKISEIQTDYIILTHGHGDHVAEVQVIHDNNSAPVIAMVEVANWFSAKEVETVGINFGGTYRFTEKTSVKYIQAHHSSSMPDGSYGGNPGSFIIKLDDKTIFMAGDTSLHYDMKMFGELYDFDVAILPIGGHFTMDHEDAAIAARYLNCKEVIGCHYDTFPVIEIDPTVAKHCFNQEGINLHLMEISNVFEL